MHQCDLYGEAYWVENLKLKSGQHIERADVLSHSEEWLEISLGSNSDEPTIWVRMNAIEAMKIVEG